MFRNLFFTLLGLIASYFYFDTFGWDMGSPGGSMLDILYWVGGRFFWLISIVTGAFAWEFYRKWKPLNKKGLK